ncbi:hypothetical protein Tco_0810458 [Tanacetum coccineum]
MGFVDRQLLDSPGKDAPMEVTTRYFKVQIASRNLAKFLVEGPGMDDEDYDLDDETHGRDDKGRGLDNEGHNVESDGLGLEEEETVSGGQRQATPVVGTTMSAPLGLGYGALRCQELALEEGDVYSTFEGGLIHDYAMQLEELSPALFESLEYEQERVVVTFGAIWRPVLALEAWARQTDAQRAALWHAVSDV